MNMNKKILLTRSENTHHGYLLSLEDGNEIESIAIINGNRPDTKLPILLCGIDQFVIFGLSHPQAITAIQEYGPQPLVTTKELGHRLFEHGMKAALGRIKIKNSWYTTSLGTYYDVVGSITLNGLVISTKTDESGNLGFVILLNGYEPVTIAFRPFEINEKVFYLDELRTMLTISPSVLVPPMVSR
jgi:hypothetical protein